MEHGTLGRLKHQWNRKWGNWLASPNKKSKRWKRRLSYEGYLYIHTMVPCDTLTPRALRVTAHAICQWVLVRFELAIFGSQAELSNHYTSVAAYILQCSFIPCVLVVLSITPLAIARGVIDSTPRFFFLSKNPSTSSRVFFLVYRLSHTSYNVHVSRVSSWCYQ